MNFMSIIAEVKCARCDRKYSGVRSKCPYCGARRIGRGKYSEEEDSSKGKMLIGVLIMAVLVVAAGVLLFTAPKAEYVEETPRNPPSESPTQNLPADDDIASFPGRVDTSPPEQKDPEEPDDSPAPVLSEVISVDITYSNRTKTDFTASIGERVPLRARIEPVGIELDVEWISSDTSVFQVVKTNPEGTAATVTGIGVGNATLTVRVGDKEAECIVRVR